MIQKTVQSFYHLFWHSVQWNALEFFLYQGLLLSYQFFFYAHMSSIDYGMLSIIFSIIYLGANFVNAGLDSSITCYFTQIHSKNNAKKIVTLHLLINSIIGIFFYGIVHQLYLKKLLLTASNVPLSLLHLLISGLIIFETIRKTLKLILQLSFQVHITTFIEIMTIIFYGAILSCFFFLTGYIRLFEALVALFIVTVVSTSTYFWYVAAWIHALPSEETAPIPFFSARLPHALSQCSSLIFSSNFIIPFVASLIGISFAGSCKLLITITHHITAMIAKIFGHAITALLSNIKHEIPARKNILTAYVRTVFHGAICLVLVLFFIISLISYRYVQLSHFLETYFLYLLCVMLSITECLYYFLEKLYIIGNHVNYLCFANTISLIVLFCSLYFFSPTSSVSSLIVIVSIRVCSYIVLHLTWPLLKPAKMAS